MRGNIFSRKDSSHPSKGQRPLLSLPQILLLLAVFVALFIALDLNRRAQAGNLVGAGEESLQTKVNIEMTQQVELQATLEYVNSEEYVADYARNEGGLLLPGEKRVVPLVSNADAQATAVPPAVPDPATNVHPWQAWWRLLTNAPQPSS